MHLLDMARLFYQQPGNSPGLDDSQFKKLLALHHQIPSPTEPLRYWGLVASHHTYRGHPLLRCYNLGNAIAEYPWSVRLINFRVDERTTIIRAGTLKKPIQPTTHLDLITTPFLVFEYAPTPALADLIQPGLMIVPSGEPAHQRRQYTIILPTDDFPRFTKPTLLHFLLCPVPFVVSSTERWISPGSVAGHPTLHIQLDQPLCLEPGWPVSITDEDRLIWGIVLQ